MLARISSASLVGARVRAGDGFLKATRELADRPSGDGLLEITQRGSRTIRVSPDLARLCRQDRHFEIGNDVDQSPAAQRCIANLILDGFLVLVEGRNDRSGAAAVESLFDAVTFVEPVSRLQSLSADALALAAWEPAAQVSGIAERLYRHNSVAASPWRRKRHFFRGGFERYTTSISSILPDWRLDTRLDSRSWFTWHRIEVADADWGIWKLYISIDHDELLDALPRILSTVTAHGATAFKLGRQLRELLRPDKMVSYFPRPQDLLSAAGALGGTLDGCTPQGVPFTGQLDVRGAISCGLDRPGTPDAPGMSWRHRITHLTAWAIHTWGHAPQPALTAQEFALVRLASEGIDACHFMPFPELER